MPLRLLLLALTLVLAAAPAARAQAVGGGAATDLLDETSAEPLVLTLDQALALAEERNFGLRTARLDVRTADAQVREAWGQVMPSVDVSGNYTRNLKQANPFAGSDVSSILGGGSQADWVAFNEQQRLDGDPMTEPIPFDVFRQRQQESLEEAGIQISSSANPFGVDNEFTTGVTVTQPLFNGSAFSAVAGAEQFKDVAQRGLARQRQMVADEVRTAFYRTLLAQAQARVVAQRVARTRTTLQEVSTRVARGTAPKFERLSAEVELANRETELVQARNDAEVQADQLKLALGLPVERPLRLEGSLRVEEPVRIMEIAAPGQDLTAQALAVALDRRDDVERARLAIELREVELRTTRAEYLPRLDAVFNANYLGRVPDDRTQLVTDPSDPFFFDETTNGFFSRNYWNPNINVGLRLSWNVFNGFQTTARAEQQQAAIEQARVDYEQVVAQVKLEVQRALRTLENARERLGSQRQNVARAETNYDFVEARVAEGVSSQVELREASDQLDQSRQNALQAAFDYLTARSALATALGVPLDAPRAMLQLTSIE